MLRFIQSSGGFLGCLFILLFGFVWGFLLLLLGFGFGCLVEVFLLACLLVFLFSFSGFFCLFEGVAFF